MEERQATITGLNIADQRRAASDAIAEYLTLNEVAARYRTTPATVRYWRHIGYGPNGAKVGTRVLYPRAEVQRFDRELAERAAGSTGVA
jgi:transposase-like protein